MYFTPSLMRPKIHEYSSQSKAAAARATAKTLPIVAAALLAEAAPVNGGIPVVEGEEPEPAPVPVAAPETELTTVVAATVVATLERGATGVEEAVLETTTTLEVSVPETTTTLEVSAAVAVDAGSEDSTVVAASVVVATGTEVVAAAEEVAGAAPAVDEKSTQISPLT